MKQTKFTKSTALAMCGLALLSIGCAPQSFTTPNSVISAKSTLTALPPASEPATAAAPATVQTPRSGSQEAEPQTPATPAPIATGGEGICLVKFLDEAIDEGYILTVCSKADCLENGELNARSNPGARIGVYTSTVSQFGSFPAGADIHEVTSGSGLSSNAIVQRLMQSSPIQVF